LAQSTGNRAQRSNEDSFDALAAPFPTAITSYLREISASGGAAMAQHPFLKSVRPVNLLSFGPNTEEIKLRPLNILIGPNGSGKSNLIEILRLLYMLPEIVMMRKEDIEMMRKEDIEPALNKATRKTNSKGKYHKIDHGAVLLGQIDPVKVGDTSPHAADFNKFRCEL
jgi:hypothetical protein